MRRLDVTKKLNRTLDAGHAVTRLTQRDFLFVIAVVVFNAKLKTKVVKNANLRFDFQKFKCATSSSWDLNLNLYLKIIRKLVPKVQFESTKAQNRACERCMEKLKAYDLIGMDNLQKASALSIYIRLDFG